MVSYCLDAFNKDTLTGKLYTNGLCNDNKGVVKIGLEYNRSSERKWKFIMSINNCTEYLEVESIKNKDNDHQFSVDDWLNKYYNTDTVSIDTVPISLDPRIKGDPFTNNVDYIKTVTGDYYNISNNLKIWKKITAPSDCRSPSYWAKVKPASGQPYWGRFIPIDKGPSIWGRESIPESQTHKITNDPCAEFATGSTSGGKKKRRKTKRRKSNKKKSKRRKSKKN